MKVSRTLVVMMAFRSLRDCACVCSISVTALNVNLEISSRSFHS